MVTEIAGYEILGESVDDLLDGEYGDNDDILGDDFELVGEEMLLLGLDDDDDDDLLGLDDDDDLLGMTDPAMVGKMSAGMRRYLKAKRSGRYAAQARGQKIVVARKRRQRRQRIAAAVAAKSAAVVREKPPTESREYPMGFDTVGTVAAGANVQIISRPQVTFRPERLVIGGAIAASFLVNDIKVGKNSQLTNSAALPGDAFAPTAFGVRLRMDTAQISMDVVLDVTNISAGALRFNAALFGKAIQ